jgi:hypothetical protein
MRSFTLSVGQSTLAILASLLCFYACQEKEDPIIIVVDDVIMLSVPAIGLEGIACTNFPNSRSGGIAPNDSLIVNWSEGKSLPNDTLKIIRLEILRDTGSVAKFTMTLRPLSEKPSEIQCMKGFGCDGGAWENFPWIAPGSKFLDQTVQKFRVIPRGKDRFTIENYNVSGNLMVKVNPPI